MKPSIPAQNTCPWRHAGWRWRS